MTSSLRTNSAAILSYSFAPAIGDTKMSALLNDHQGWLICDGRSLDKIVHKHLFDAIGYTFGGSGSSFLLPDGRGRVAGAIGRSESNSLNPITFERGDLCGNQLHQLDISEMPAHKHGSVDVTGNTNGNGFTGISGEHDHGGSTSGLIGGSSIVNSTENVYNSLSPLNAVVNAGEGTHDHAISSDGAHAHSIGSTGGGAMHNNMQPTIFIGNLFIYSGRPKYPSNILYPSHRIVYY
jgi:microcystin-dependent protein